MIVANAGIAHRVPLAALDDEKWDHTFDIDLKGIFRVVRPAVAGMRARKRAPSSACPRSWASPMAGTSTCTIPRPRPASSAWCAALRSNCAKDGVRVNGVAPGYIRTAQLLSRSTRWGPKGAEAAGAFIPMGRIGEPEEIADVIVFLASDGARYMTGQVVVVDGGLLVGRY